MGFFGGLTRAAHALLDHSAISGVLSSTAHTAADHSALPGIIKELVSGESAEFTTTVGSWVNSGGTLTRDTTAGHRFLTLAASLKFATTAQNQYIELPLSGTFKAGREYQALVLIKQESHAGSGQSYKIGLGLIGTDDNDIQSSGAINQMLTYSPMIVRWRPTADRTTVKLRFTRQGAETGTINWHIGWVRVVEVPPNGLGVALSRMPDTDEDTLMLGTDFGGVNITAGGYPTEAAYMYFSRTRIQMVSREGTALSSSGAEVTRSTNSPGEGDLNLWAEHTMGDFAGWGIQFSPGEGDVALYMGQKDATTLQMYAAFDDHDVECADSATKGWKFRSDDDAIAWPAKGMRPQYSAAPSSPVEGQSYYNTTDHIEYTWNGTTWKAHYA